MKCVADCKSATSIWLELDGLDVDTNVASVSCERHCRVLGVAHIGAIADDQ